MLIFIMIFFPHYHFHGLSTVGSRFRGSNDKRLWRFSTYAHHLLL